MIRLRHADEWIGLLVVLATLIFLGVILQAGALRDWFRPVETLRLVLPEDGVGGLAVGDDVEVLGTKAGTVRRILINPNQQMFAEVEIDEQARAFIRRDSRAVIRRRFGIAGATYVDVSRGSGPELDWDFAVINAATERAPTENVGALIDQVREKVFPILDDVGRSARSLAGIIERIERGEGNLGRLLTDDRMARDAEMTIATAHVAMSSIDAILAQLDSTLTDIAKLSRTLNASGGNVPSLVQRADQLLVSLHAVINDLSQATRRAPQIASNIEGGTANLPTLLIQMQQTAHEMEQLLAQLRGHWLLSGGGPPAPAPTRLPPTEVRP
jgi:phospholipid/cholesterol/gamma-HCH transport system substrate-binding protein